MSRKATAGSFKPGDKRAGRPKGTPNKATGDVRAVFAQFVEGNATRAQALWETVAKDDPARALELLAKMAEFVVPKLARTELSGELAVRGKLVIQE